MAGNAAGALKAQARRCGLTVEEVEQRRAAGLKWCTGCKDWHPRDEFTTDRSRGDGLAAACRVTTRRWQRIPPEQQRPKGGPTGWHQTPDARARIAAAQRGRVKGPHSPATKAKISATLRQTAARGPAAPGYKDGKTAERRGVRFSAEYKRWRYDVFTRDNFTCQHCGDDRGGNLVAHHINGFAAHPELRFVLANGLTLCRDCHDAHHEEHGYG